MVLLYEFLTLWFWFSRSKFRITEITDKFWSTGFQTEITTNSMKRNVNFFTVPNLSSFLNFSLLSNKSNIFEGSKSFAWTCFFQLMCSSILPFPLCCTENSNHQIEHLTLSSEPLICTLNGYCSFKRRLIAHFHFCVMRKLKLNLKLTPF